MTRNEIMELTLALNEMEDLGISVVTPDEINGTVYSCGCLDGCF